MATSVKAVAEGSVFLIPLVDSGIARGVLARSNGKGSAFGYFFGPRLMDASAASMDDLSPQKAILVAKFGDHGLHIGKWPVIGRIENWDRSVWKLPKFSREHDRPELRYLVAYDDKLKFLSEDIVPSHSRELEGLPYDSQLGSGIVEVKLGRMLPGSLSAH